MFETLTRDHLWLFALWGLYFFIHSLLADNYIKAHFKRVFPKQDKYYRIIYNTVAQVTLIPVLWYAWKIPGQHIIPNSLIGKVIGLLVLGSGWWLGRVSFKVYDKEEFLGTKQLKSEKPSVSKLETTGMLKYVRHPLYSATILIVLGIFIFAPTITNLVSATAIVLYLFIGIYLEEKKLIREFGQEYIEYKRITPMLVPNLAKKLRQ